MSNSGNNINLFKFIPEQLKYKLLKLEKQDIQENIEVSVIFNGEAQRVAEEVKGIGGSFIDLDYGFGIVSLPLSNIDKISSIAEIVYAELPKVLYTTFLPSNQESCIPSVWSTYDLTGKGVIVGVIDSGIDYLHPAFRTIDGKTRIKCIYDIQSGEIWQENQINDALQSKEPYSIVPQRDILGHGTHVTAIACGGGNIEKRYYGVAYESDIIMVKMTREGTASYTKSTQIMRAIKFLIDKSREYGEPIVINLSFSTNDGAHDGNSILELYIKTIASIDRVSICIAGGNEGEAGHHVGGLIEVNNTVLLNIGAQEKVITLQLYKNFADTLSIEIINPMATSSRQIDISSGNYFDGNLGFDKYYIYNSGPSPFNIVGEVLIVIENLRGDVTEGTWKIGIYANEGNIVNEFDMWLPITEGLNPNTKFFNPNPYNTLGIPATVENVISVGSYNYVTGNISSFSGRGRRIGIPPKPDIVAPGENIESAFPGGGYSTLSGTSMATPQVTGAVALLTQWGLVEGNDPYMYGQRLKYYLLKGAERTRRDIIYPNALWGYGKLCLSNAINVWLQEGNTRGNRDVEFYRDVNVDEGYKLNIESAFPCLKSFYDPNYNNFIVEYEGNIATSLEKVPYACGVPIEKNYALVSIKRGMEEQLFKDVKEIIFFKSNDLYTLNEVSPIQTSNIYKLQNNTLLNLRGQGVLIGIIDTGVDYLNKDLIYEDDTSKIVEIWDQTIYKEGVNKIVGRIYSNEEINKAIKAEKNGANPYDIVESKDENGHGTEMSVIMTGRGNVAPLGAAPDSELVAVKLKPMKDESLISRGYDPKEVGLVYGTTDILLAIRYLYGTAEKYNRPMVICMPLGSNAGGHDGNTLLERYIDINGIRRGVIFVTSTGNQGDDGIHYLEKINKTGDMLNVELKVDPIEKNLEFEIWTQQPDRVSIGLVSPSGEVIDRIPSKIKKQEKIKFIYEGSEATIKYLLPEETSGDEVIDIRINNIKGGIWQIRIYGDYIINGDIDIWLPQRPLTKEGTRFLKSNPASTLQNPGTGKSVIVTSWYNQNNNTIVADSGQGYTTTNAIRPDITTGGVNVTTSSIGSITKVVSGGSVAAAILSGAIALILEWGIVKGNDVSLYYTKIRAYLTAGARRRQGDIYPNRQWGYGQLDLNSVFESARNIRKALKSDTIYVDRDNIYNMLRNNFRNGEDNVISLKGGNSCVVEFNNPNYNNYIVEYTGDISSSLSKIPYACGFVIEKNYAVLSIENGKEDQLFKDVDQIVFFKVNDLYTLNQVSPIQTANIYKLQNNTLLNLRGQGVLMGLIDTGVDYLNEDLIYEDGTTKIVELWDQSIIKENSKTIGEFYSGEDIDKAIRAKKNGQNPYDIVESRDENGHGTEMAVIMTGRGNIAPLGAAPDAELVVVKLRTMKEESLRVRGYNPREVGLVYGTTDIVLAIKYLYEIAEKYKRPMVICMPFGSNAGGHDGNSVLERYIDVNGTKRGIIFVTSTGNQGDDGTHYMDVINKTGDILDIELKVDDIERNLDFDIWTKQPDKVSVGLVSPSGEIIERIPAKIKKYETAKFIFEGSEAFIRYFLPEEATGDEVINIQIKNIKGGIWRIRVYGDYIVNGDIDIWLPQRPLIKPDTRFLKPNPTSTLQNPGTGKTVIVTSCYDQNNNTLVAFSGQGYTRMGAIRPDITTGGISVTTSTVGNVRKTVTGGSVSVSVLAGAVALILEWGIVKGNDVSLYYTKVRAYLISGAKKRKGDIYPNRQWGYGQLDIYNVFENVRSFDKIKKNEVISDNKKDGLVVSIPKEMMHYIEKLVMEKSGQ